MHSLDVRFGLFSRILSRRNLRTAAAAAALVLLSGMTLAAGPIRPVVEIEEQVYSYEPANNGAGPMWCAGSTCIVRSGDRVFASGLETIPDAKPLNNCRWVLFERTEKGWRRIHEDGAGRTREPAPIVLMGANRLLLSANPTLGERPEPNGGPARPEIFEFNLKKPEAPPSRYQPVWLENPKFTEHSYRSFAAGQEGSGMILLQNIGYTHAEWTFQDRQGKWKAQGKLQWPWGAEYDKPQPIRVCYPNVAVDGNAVHFFGVSDVLEPYLKWKEFKRQITGREWDYDFRRLFYTWTPDITREPFRPWIEVVSRDKTAGATWPCDLWIGADKSVHVLWTERALDERLREKFFPKEKQSEGLYYGVLREGRLAIKMALEERNEATPGIGGSAARFHATKGGRLVVVYNASGTDRSGAAISENRLVEVLANGRLSEKTRLPLGKPFVNWFSATERAGSGRSEVIDMLGQQSGTGNVISYARVRLQ